MEPTSLFSQGLSARDTLLHYLYIFFAATPDDTLWATTIIWILRIATFLLILRNYIAPYVLEHFSEHMRVRSISLRSIRGIYFRRGFRTWRVDRIGISYRSASGEGASRFTVKIEGLKLEIGRREKVQRSSASTGKRRLTLSDLSPSPLASRLWSTITDLYSLVEPIIRPLVRTVTVMSIRVIIRSLPALTQALHFDLDSAEVTFSESPQSRLRIKEASLQTQLNFTQLEDMIYAEDTETKRESVAASRMMSFAALRSRLRKSFGRTWERAWGKTHGSASITLSVKAISGVAPSTGVACAMGSESFLNLPGAINLSGSLDFSPRRGTIDQHSLKVDLEVDSVHVCVDRLQSVLRMLDDHHQFDPLSPSVEVPPDPTPLNSPTSPMASPTSPMTPMAPLFGAFRSASRLPASHSQRQNSKSNKTLSWVSVLKGINVHPTTVELTSMSAQGDEFAAAFQKVQVGLNLSSPDQSSLHRETLGRSPSDDDLEAEVYVLDVATSSVAVHRVDTGASERLQVLYVGKTHTHVLVSQWPTPWLASSRFLVGDPNASLLAARLFVESIELTERLDALKSMLLRFGSPPKPTGTVPGLPAVLSPVPRLVLTVEIGSICGRIICAKPSGMEPFAVEARTDGFTAVAHSRFVVRSHSSVKKGPISEYLPVQMMLETSFILKPTFVRILTEHNAGISPPPKLVMAESSPGDPLLSLETVELVGQVLAVGDFKDDTESVVLLDTASILADFHCSIDALLFEIWHPNVLAATSILLRAFEKPTAQSPTSSSRPLLDKLPAGITFTFALARLVFFVTAPDLNPAEESGITRGVAFRTGLSFSYCSLRPIHAQYFRSLWSKSQTRHKLYLSEEHTVESVAAAKSSAMTQQVQAYFRIGFWDTMLRSAAATQYVADDPYISERDDPALKAHEFLHVQSIRVDANLFGKRGHAATDGLKDICQTSLEIPSVRATFQLLHVYSMLLAAQTVSSIFRRDHRESQLRTIRAHPSTLAFNFKAKIKTLQVFCDLITQKLASRFDHIDAHFSSHAQPGLGWTSLVVWVPPLQRSTQGATGERKWDELGRLQSWNLSLPQPLGTGAFVVEGDSLRLRIPYGFVLAHLIRDLTVTVKALRHLKNMVASHSYSDMPSPSAEAAKAIPNLTIQIRSLFLEAADDPFECKLGLIWRTGFEACRQRIDREDAFKAKVAAILAAETQATQENHQSESDYQFTPLHSISVEDAYVRLSMVHTVDWTLRLREQGEKRSAQERASKQRLQGQAAMKRGSNVPDLVPVAIPEDVPPLLRLVLCDVKVQIQKPSFPESSLPDFLHERGSGLPRDTQFTLLVPMHLNISLGSLRVSLRDYPLPLLCIKENSKKSTLAFEFDTDLVVAEEMGTARSIDRIECPVVGLDGDIQGAKSMTIYVPKTMMPVKTYACPIIHVAAEHVTSFAWGNSYGAATQDVTRVIETLTHPPPDSSPGVGFWDKMRLIFHWKIKVTFAKEVRLHMKGTRDPYNIKNTGAGFALCWQGHPTLTINYANPDNELIQMISDSMLIVIPNFSDIDGQTVSNTGAARRQDSSSTSDRDFRKICAKFSSGVRFGFGFVAERSCGAECSTCNGTAFERKCRFFDFRPHFDVKLEKKDNTTILAKTLEDSYNGFRSDFIHLSVSLTSSLQPPKLGKRLTSSSLHLSPKAFAHFWSWWALFEGVMSLPIRQGTYYPPRSISPKFGRHLATLKYRISVAQLFISHAYIDDSRQSWVDGVTPFVGMKAMIDNFQADMHQRDQESIVPGKIPDSIKVVRHKPFYAAEVVMNGLDLRTMMAVFPEPLKQSVEVTPSDQGSPYRSRDDLPTIEPSSTWFDLDDFVELDWLPVVKPTAHLLPTAACSRLTYFKRNSQSEESRTVTSKFGQEHTHSCFLGKESSVSQIQIRLASERLDDLEQDLKSLRRQQQHNFGKNSNANNDQASQLDEDERSLSKKIALLADYIYHLREVDESSHNHGNREQTYYMPSDSVSPDEWSDFDNVYQVHSPKIFVDNAIRDILMQYYHSSRGWRGLEYHMATRAVKFIRDQAGAIIGTNTHDLDDDKQTKVRPSGAQAAANALRKILIGEGGPNRSNPAVEVTDAKIFDPNAVNPMGGWSDGVSLRKSHFCLLLKPQIVLRSESNVDAVCVLAAVQAKLQSFAVMDDSNVEDPISGKIMTRSYTSLNGLQTFSPATADYDGDGCVPLEVLIDYRCESSDFDRLVPQTDATFHYDKFNRLRLRNNVTSVARSQADDSALGQDSHLQNETDLVQIHVPRFTVSAGDHHFQDISNIVTKLILFSDAAHKTHLERLDTMVFAYDFSDLASAANVVSNLQGRLRHAAETRKEAEHRFSATGYEGNVEILKLKAHAFLLAEELNLIFDAIKLAQDRAEDDIDQKSALLLNASASEISWRMLDDSRDLLAKLAMRDIDYSWLSRQDSSTVNKLAIGDLQAFDGSPHAVWPEILSKHHEPANHPLVKRELFILADWTVLAPVGGITIYETFELSLHPMRLQVDAKIGSRIMEYVWPARKQRALEHEEQPNTPDISQSARVDPPPTPIASRQSLDSSRALDRPRGSLENNRLAPPPLRKLGVSRSFTDLRSSAKSDFAPPPRSAMTLKPRANDLSRADHSVKLSRTDSTKSNLVDLAGPSVKKRVESGKQVARRRKIGDAAEMKTRSSQKTFIMVKISSLHLLLSIIKEESFDLRDARIRTRDLEYRNQTWSFEELVDQFIPSDMTWKGWVKMAFHQPLVPVLPVARELISKTKWIASKGAAQIDAHVPSRTPRLLLTKDDTEGSSDRPRKRSQSTPGHRRLRKKSIRGSEMPPPLIASDIITAEPEPIAVDDIQDGHSDDEREARAPRSRSRMLNIFHHSSSHTPTKSASRHRSDTVTPRSSRK